MWPRPVGFMGSQGSSGRELQLEPREDSCHGVSGGLKKINPHPNPLESVDVTSYLGKETLQIYLKILR